MTPKATFSIPNAPKRERSDGCHENAVTRDWPAGACGRPLVIKTVGDRAAVLKGR
jgi:hypothetical protein